MKAAEKRMRRESLVLRILWMLLFLLVWQIAVPLLGILVVAQLLYRLFYGAPSAHFMGFGDSLSQYLAHIGRFAVFNTDAKPWPVADWPQARAADGEAAHVAKGKQVVASAPLAAEGTQNVPQSQLEPAVATEAEAEAGGEGLSDASAVESGDKSSEQSDSEVKP